MSLEYDIEEFPEMWSKELVDAVKNYKDGKRNAKRNLRKFVNREISQYYYDELIERFAALYRINKEERKHKEARKIKDAFCRIISMGTILLSHLYVLSYLTRYGAGTALGYLLLSFWAFNYILSSSCDEGYNNGYTKGYSEADKLTEERKSVISESAYMYGYYKGYSDKAENLPYDESVGKPPENNGYFFEGPEKKPQ